jgi:hypothetical protein
MAIRPRSGSPSAAALPLEVRPIGGLRLVPELELVIESGGLPDRVADVLPSGDWPSEDACLEDHILVHQFRE